MLFSFRAMVTSIFWKSGVGGGGAWRGTRAVASVHLDGIPGVGGAAIPLPEDASQAQSGWNNLPNISCSGVSFQSR